MMCEFCEDTDTEPISDIEYFEDIKRIERDGIMAMKVYVTGSLRSFSFVPAFYCPACGRRLERL